MQELFSKILNTEPARLSEFVRALLMAVVAVGWVSITDSTINIIVTVVSAVASFGLTKFTRNKVTPIAGTWAPEPNNRQD